MSIGTVAMARPKEKPDADPSEERTTVINLKGSQALSDWLTDINRTTHLSKAVIVRLSLRLWAEHNGHPLPPDA